MTVATRDRDDLPLLEEAGIWCVRMAHGELDGGDLLAFEQWIGQSDAHRAAFEDVVRTWHGVDEISLQPDMIAHRSQALESFGRANRARWSPRAFGLRPLLAIAASLALLVVAITLYTHYAFTTYATGIGERRVVRLDDGSRVSLDADTRIRVRYGGSRRALELVQGRAKFDVATDSLRPFTVAAANRIVVARGTAFSVELLGDRVHVILYEGQVAVLDANQPSAAAPASAGGAPQSAAPEVHLSPGRELIASASAVEQQQIVPADLGRTLTWESGLLTFEDELLQTAVERVNRYSDTRLAVADARAARLLVNGVYPSGNSQAFVEGVTGVLPLRVEMRGNVRTLVATD